MSEEANERTEYQERMQAATAVVDARLMTEGVIHGILHILEKWLVGAEYEPWGDYEKALGEIMPNGMELESAQPDPFELKIGIPEHRATLTLTIGVADGDYNIKHKLDLAE